MTDARKGIEELEAAGIDGVDIVLLGPRAEVADTVPRDRADHATGAHTAFWLTVGTVGGTVVGALIGAVFMGALVLLWPGGIANPWWTWALTAGWVAAAGAVAGAYIALTRKSGFSDSWELAVQGAADELEHPGRSTGPVHVAVFGPSDRVSEALQHIDAVAVETDPDVVTRPPSAAGVT